MVSANYLSLLFLASTALAAPALNRRCGEMITPPGVSWSFPNCFDACASHPACAKGQPQGQTQPKDQTQTEQKPEPKVVAPQPEAKPQGGSGGNSNVDIVNKYRGIMKVPTLSFSDKLQANIQNTLNANPGKMVHVLNPGTNGQVLAQGDCNDFTNSLVHGWICEIPSLLPGGSCDGGNYNLGGQTGHAKILSDASFKSVACACSSGIWGCDFAM